MSYIEHAIQELDLLEVSRPDLKDYRTGFIAIVEAFAKSEFPGGFVESAASDIGMIITNLLSMRSLMPVGGDESEWVDMSSYGNPDKRCDQNRRNPAVFRDDTGVYYLDAIFWVDEQGRDTSGWVEGYSSLCYTTVLPFTPLTFRINVRTIDADNCVYEIVDRSQLEVVWTHYQQQTPSGKTAQK